MAFSRLIFTKSEPRLSKHRRWFCAAFASSSTKKVSKRSEASKEKKTVAVKSFLQSYMEKNDGSFPKTKQVQDAIGGSWYILKDILSEMRDKDFPLKLEEEKFEEKERDFDSELKENEGESEEIRASIEENCPKLEGNCSEIECESVEIMASIEDKCPKLDQSNSQIEAKTEQISSLIRENDKKNLDSNITHTKPSSLLNVIKGLINGPQNTEILPIYLKQDQSEERELEHGINKKELKYLDNMINAFKGLERKPEGLNVNLLTAKRDRNRADSYNAKSILNVITEKDTSNKQNKNSSSFHESFSFLNPKPNPSSKREGSLIDFFNKMGGNGKHAENKAISDDSDSVDFEEEGPICEENEKCKYGLLVGFLEKNIRIEQIEGKIGGICGPIESLRFLPSDNNDQFNSAVIFFKTEQGLKNALQLTDPSMCKSDITLQPLLTSLTANAELAVLDPHFPVNLLKYPSRSVVVKGLTKSISFDQLRYLMEPFGTVCGMSMGTSSSIVYVEFQSEESCEKALAAAKLESSGIILCIFRVYSPKTNVVRISNVRSESVKSGQIPSRCRQLGNFKRLVQRSGTVFDVHFCNSESPNILKIINRLNGMVVDKNKWVVQPSTFVPVGIIQSLWNSEEGRKQLQEIFQNICAKMEVKNARNILPLTRLSDEFVKNG